jgi:hypothetical protein
MYRSIWIWNWLETKAKVELAAFFWSQEHHCQHVLPLIEKNPCINGTKHINAIVTKLLPFDFDKWQKDYKVPSKCLLN